MLKTPIQYTLISYLLLLSITRSHAVIAQVNTSTNANQLTKELSTTVPVIHFDNIPYNEIKAGSLFVKSKAGYFVSASQNSAYEVNVTGLLARVSLTQTFKNDSDNYIEAVYIFPLNEGAAVDSLKMKIGERVINGVIKEKQQANKLYKKAKEEGKKTSLVSQHRPNIFQTKLANIAPGETIDIQLSYLQRVKYNENEFSLRLPLTITPRFTPTTVAADNKNQAYKEQDKKTPELTSEQKEALSISTNGWSIKPSSIDIDNSMPKQISSSVSQKVSIGVDINAGMSLVNINSHYHSIIKTESAKQGSYKIALKNNKTKMDHDFYLSWQLGKGNSPEAAFFTSKDDTHHYGLLMVMPNSDNFKWSNNDGNAAKEIISKEVIYIIDTSGSMGGVAIRQAKKALINAIEQLNENDNFNIIAFESTSTSLYSSSALANNYNKNSAINWVNRLQASGGTNMFPAIEKALNNNSLSAKEDNGSVKYKQVIFITDGAVGNEDALIKMIEKKLGNTRLHTIGIGSAPNAYFMSYAANVGRGTHRYIANINEVEKQMDSLFEIINNPSMQDIALTWSVEGVEVTPNRIPDLYKGQPLLITARWPNTKYNIGEKLSVNIAGKLPRGYWQKDIELSNVNESSGISTWWARGKIKQLSMAKNRSNNADSKLKIKKAITSLGLKHKLVTQYTSFIAIENKLSRPPNESIKKQSVRNLIPKGSDQLLSQSIPLASTSLGSFGYLMSGVILMLLSLFLHFVTFSKTVFKFIKKIKGNLESKSNSKSVIANE